MPPGHRLPRQRTWSQTSPGLEDRPADLGPPLRRVSGVALADEKILAHATIDPEGVARYVARQGAVGAVDVARWSLVLDDRQFRAAPWPAGPKFCASLANLSVASCNREAMDDDELIARLAGGDDRALRELFQRHAPFLAARLRGVLPPSEVEDVLQETFLAAWRGAASYQPLDTAGGSKAGGWLWGIARRQAALLLRRRGPAHMSLPDGLMVHASAHGDRPPDDPAETIVTQAHLESAVSTLSPAEHEVWRLIYVEDRPLAEVAELTGVPEGTVKSRAHRARRLLRSALRGTALGGGLG
jgi:RNA polymerase sigma-70 factor, ECF subfamily